MSREVRRVPANWEHPKKWDVRYTPLHGGSWRAEADKWKADYAAWERGERPSYYTPANYPNGVEFWEYDGGPPKCDDYMPDWPEAERTHFQMYETVSEGTPISPVFATVEGLARWLADNDASASGSMTATYEQWLAMCRQGYSEGSMVMSGGVMMSGVAAVSALREGK